MNGYIDSLKLNQNTLREMLEEAWQLASHDPNRVRRRTPRIGLPPRSVGGLEIASSSDGDRVFLVRPYDISPGGVGLLHGAYLHPGTQVKVVLSLRDLRVMRIAGRVVRCDHLHQRVHSVGIAFAQPLDPALMPDGEPEAPVASDGAPAAGSPIAGLLGHLGGLAERLAGLCASGNSLEQIDPLVREVWKIWREGSAMVAEAVKQAETDRLKADHQAQKDQGHNAPSQDQSQVQSQDQPGTQPDVQPGAPAVAVSAPPPTAEAHLAPKAA